jgi:hypothetical protein
MENWQKIHSINYKQTLIDIKKIEKIRSRFNNIDTLEDYPRFFYYITGYCCDEFDTISGYYIIKKNLK